MNEFVSVHTSDEQPGIATLLLSRPPTNALTRQVYRELISAAEEVSQRADIAAVILFGGHEIFCAGDDVPELRTLSAEEAGVGAGVRHDAIEAVAAIPKPTVAASSLLRVRSSGTSSPAEKISWPPNTITARTLSRAPTSAAAPTSSRYT